MPEAITLFVNGLPVVVAKGSVLTTAVVLAGKSASRISITGQPRGPLCGMGICFECRVTINGEPHLRSCQILCEHGMDVRTDD
jgi:aerobic-type carbon monoxide dehydrogenase small subunit (CoxS/CutS family)